jgi:ParB-like chromosome segregation protein Spo0J
LNLPLGEIYTDESLRKVRTGGLNEVLRASIAEMGQQVAVLVTPIGSKLRRELKIPKTKRYYLVTGFGRYDTLTDLGKKTIRANVEVLSHLDAIDRYLKSNMHEETYVDQ